MAATHCLNAIRLPWTVSVVLLLIVWNMSCDGAAATSVLSKVDVRYRWVYKNPTARAPSHRNATAEPVPLLYSHMGMLEVLPNGSLAAAWQGSENFWEGSDGQGIHWAISDDGGASWGGQETLVPAPDNLPAWGPVLHTQGGEVHLFYAVSKRQCWWVGEGGMHWACGGDLMMQSSSDNGASWSTPRVIYSYSDEGGISKMLANHLGTTSGGDWALPVWREMGGQQVCNTHPELHGTAGVLLSSDQGRSWTVYNVSLAEGPKPTWLIEGAMAKIGKISWLQVFRTSVGFVYSSRSDDDGTIWTPARPTHVRNPNSKVDMLAWQHNTLLLAYNDDSEASRSTLLLAVSTNEGHSWHDIAVLEADPRGSFHYPTLLYHEKQDTVLVIYSVDYLPDASSSSGNNSLDGVSSQAQWRCLSAEPGTAQPNNSEGIETLQSSQCRPANAWGKESWGMRLASVQGAAVRRIASALREQTVAAA